MNHGIPLFVSFVAASLFPFAWTGEAEPVDSAWQRDLGSPVLASPVLADVDKDGLSEIAISALSGSVYLLDNEGEILPGWPQTVALFQQVSPTIADLDGDGSVEVVLGDDAGMLHAWEINGMSVSGFPVQLEGTIKSVVQVRDVGGDEKPEILLHSGESRLYLLDASGANVTGWPVELGGEKDQFGSWALASTPHWVDLEGDGNLEVVVGTTRDDVQAFRLDGSAVEGWSATVGDWVYPSVVAVDLVGDDSLEFVAGAGDGKLYAWDASGGALAGFPIDIGEPMAATVAIGNVDGAGGLEIVAADLDGGVHCYHADGSAVAGWPQQMSAGSIGSPLLIDVDADGALDVVAPSRDNTLHLWQADGTVIATPVFAATDWIESTPVAADIDGDGLVELIYASHDGVVRSVDLGTVASEETLAWAGFLGESGFKDAFVPGDMDRDGLPDTYETEVFGNLEQSDEGDFDGDGRSNFEECVAGTDPKLGTDWLRVSVLSRGVGDDREFGLQWNGKAGRAYRVYARDALSGGNGEWYLVSGDEVIEGDADELVNWFDERGLEKEKRFYRVEVERL